MPATPSPETVVLETETWQARARAHLERVHVWTLPRRERRARRESHPVYDFLFQYYRYSAAKLEAWHPEPGECVVDSTEARERFTPPEYRAADGVIARDPRAIDVQILDQLRTTVGVLRSTEARPANFGCYGVHEWAMIYGGHDIRHADVTPLRLPQAEVDAFVDSRPVACSHFDAFRFFAPAAKPLNRLDVAWSNRHEMEQPGCVHANMDLYRWAYTSMPWIGTALLWKCFALAVDLRILDMRASPYDLRAMGFDPVCVETPEGRDAYQTRQRALAHRAALIRTEMIDRLTGLFGGSPG